MGAISAAAKEDSRPAMVFYLVLSFHSRAGVIVNARAFPPFFLGFLFAPAPLALALVRTAGVSAWFCVRRVSSIAAAAAAGA